MMVLPVDEYYSKHAERRADRYAEEAFGAVFREQRRVFVDALNGDRVLDAGCGHGRDTAFFCDEGLDAVGVDVAGGLVDYAKSNMRGSYDEMDMRDLRFDAASFDGLWCCASLYFMTPGEMRAVICAFERVLRAGGVLYVSVKTGPFSQRCVKERWGDGVAEYVLSGDDADELMRASSLRAEEEWCSSSL